MLVRTDLTHLDGILPKDEVHVWHTDVAGNRTIRELSDLLDAAEQERASRFKVSSARDQFVVAHGFLRIALGRYLQAEPRDLRFHTAEHGKPGLAGNQDLHFNLSHTDDAVIIAVTRAGQVGVDVERVRENLDPQELADRFFSRQESEWLRSQPAPERFSSFFACWTAKEAYIKACGGGLSMGLADFSVIPHQDREQLELQLHGKSNDRRRWSMWRLDLGPDLHSALAIEGQNVSLRLGRWSFQP